MISSSPIARLVSVPNATRLFHALPKRAFASTPASSSARLSEFFTHNANKLRASTPLSPGQPTAGLSPLPLSSFSSRLFSSSSSAARPNIPGSSSSTPFTKAASSASPFQAQVIRGFSRRAWRAEQEPIREAARDFWHRGWRGDATKFDRNELHKHFHDSWGRHGAFRGYHHHNHFMRRRRPMRSMFRLMFLSTVLVAAPAVIFLDAPWNTLAYVPLTVFGVGATLMVMGRLMFIALPILTIGGAALIFVGVVPAVNVMKDLKKVLKRDENANRYTTALSTLGPNWEVQRAQPDEWFRWTFPKSGDKEQLDKIDVRFVVFDPKGKGGLKKVTQACFDGKDMVKPRKDYLENLKIDREGNHVVVHMEGDGEKMMREKAAKKYLAIGRVVDRAAKEMEAAQPGLNLGDQVVLVYKYKDDAESSFSRMFHRGELSVRIPFSRTWINDLSSL